MKKIIYFFSLIIAALSCTNKPQYIIKGKIPGVKSGTILLQQAINDKKTFIDSALIINGKFKLKGSISSPELYTLIYRERWARLPIFLENAPINIIFNIDTIKNSTIEGSSSHDELVDYYEKADSIQKHIHKIHAKFYEAKKVKATDKQLLKTLDSSYTSIKDDVQKFAVNYIKNNKSSYVSAYLADIYLFYIMHFSELEPIINDFDKSLENNNYIKDIKYKIDVSKRTSIGQYFPNLSLKDTTGISVSLYTFVGKQKVLLINFWAGWCDGCMEDSKELAETYQKYKERGFGVVGISFDKEKSEWINAIGEAEACWLQLSDLEGKNSPLVNYLNLQSIPYHFLLDEKFVIIGKGSSCRRKELLKKLEEYLDK